MESIFEFAGMRQEEEVVAACVADVRRSLDRDRDGTITKVEFVQNARYP